MALGLAAGIAASTTATADDDHERHERHDSRRGSVSLAAENPVYKQECSSCHFLYLPGLLPARSWVRIMDNSDKHFGDNLALDEQTKKEILAYLTANSSEKTNTEWGQKITKSAANTTPERITDVPWIQKEHRKLDRNVFKRPSIGSFSNCGACHKTAAEGDFEEDNVSVPKN